MKLVKLDVHVDGACPNCGETDLRVSLENTFYQLVWCPDCMMGQSASRPVGELHDCMDYPTLFEQSQVIHVIRKQEIQQLREDHDHYKSGLFRILKLVKAYEDSGVILQELCEILNLDYNETVEGNDNAQD